MRGWLLYESYVIATSQALVNGMSLEKKLHSQVCNLYYSRCSGSSYTLTEGPYRVTTKRKLRLLRDLLKRRGKRPCISFRLKLNRIVRIKGYMMSHFSPSH